MMKQRGKMLAARRQIRLLLRRLHRVEPQQELLPLKYQHCLHQLVHVQLLVRVGYDPWDGLGCR